MRFVNPAPALAVPHPLPLYLEYAHVPCFLGSLTVQLSDSLLSYSVLCLPLSKRITAIIVVVKP